MRSYSAENEKDIYEKCLSEYRSIIDETVRYFSRRVYRFKWRNIPLPDLRGVVLDVGSGYTGEWLSSNIPAGSRLVLLDLNPTGLEKTGSGKPNVICVVGDALMLPFIDAAFTRVLMLALLHHIPGDECRRLALKEAYRALANEGILIATVWSPSSLPSKTRLSDGFIITDDFGTRFVHLFDKESLVSLVSSMGLKVLEAGFFIENPRRPDVTTNIFVKAEKRCVDKNSDPKSPSIRTHDHRGLLYSMLG